jgi:indole-3-glycerol phosphate synthase
MPPEVADVLRRIVAARRVRLRTIDEAPPAEVARSAGAGFTEALRAHPGRAILAEVKLGSPRLGSLVGRFDPERQARAYAAAGAAALSVVVEPEFFHGSYALLARCRAACGLPAIAKDFIVDRRQLEWARAAGAGAVLLIAALPTRDELATWADQAAELGLEVLVETHDRADVAKLAGRDWPLVGVNNRDLRTFEVDLAHSEALVSELPEAAVKVAESGLDHPDDLARLEAAGFDAFLIGESLLLAPDPEAKLRALLDRKG